MPSTVEPWGSILNHFGTQPSFSAFSKSMLPVLVSWNSIRSRFQDSYLSLSRHPRPQHSHIGASGDKTGQSRPLNAKHTGLI